MALLGLLLAGLIDILPLQSLIFLFLFLLELLSLLLLPGEEFILLLLILLVAIGLSSIGRGRALNRWKVPRMHRRTRSGAFGA